MLGLTLLVACDDSYKPPPRPPPPVAPSPAPTPAPAPAPAKPAAPDDPLTAIASGEALRSLTALS